MHTLRTVVYVFGGMFLVWLAVSLVGGLLVGLSGQPSDSPAMGFVVLLALLCVPLGAYYGWRSARR